VEGLDPAAVRADPDLQAKVDGAQDRGLRRHRHDGASFPFRRNARVKTLALSLATVATVLAFAGTAQAQSQAVQDACMGDYQKLCSGHPAGRAAASANAWSPTRTS